MGPLDQFILADDALTATPTGGAVAFRSHWYRSLPLSCMEVQLSLDGRPIPPEAMTIVVNGHTYPVEAMPGLIDEWLFITDAATLRFACTPPLERGRAYAVTLRLDLYPPYILVGPDQEPLLASSTVTRILTAA
ncbi:hypothetical protein GQ464_000165 [Rhodocaloribacter litoris]|uniref:C-glycoside deglycosidase beta subunit domain-containing protein n=1 Tax=Rhodocaloribacter litoris TaxID=2558931 RepID=UPI00141E53D5|nr:DUF6379 domain-containing protein [Rhodocaloribacter litoris]QXD15409.1 hypothetical protein GQ464_000165 [Rhodocaloribacter litoris]